MLEQALNRSALLVALLSDADASQPAFTLSTSLPHSLRAPAALTIPATSMPPLTTCTVAVIGLGYVGLPLAVEFAKSQTCLRSGATLRRIPAFS